MAKAETWNGINLCSTPFHKSSHSTVCGNVLTFKFSNLVRTLFPEASIFFAILTHPHKWNPDPGIISSTTSLIHLYYWAPSSFFFFSLALLNLKYLHVFVCEKICIAYMCVCEWLRDSWRECVFAYLVFFLVSCLFMAGYLNKIFHVTIFHSFFRNASGFSYILQKINAHFHSNWIRMWYLCCFTKLTRNRMDNLIKHLEQNN